MTKVAAKGIGGRCSTLKPKKEKVNKKKKKNKNKNVNATTLKHTDDVQVEQIQEDEKNIIEIIKDGDHVDISNLLFTPYRDYLIKPDGDKVKAEDLAGKLIIIYFVSVSLDDGFTQRQLTADLLDMYAELQKPKYGFEVVWVPVVKHKLASTSLPQQGFNHRLASMPWPCIPFSDLPSAQRLLTKFGPFTKRDFPRASIIDPAGKVLYRDSNLLIQLYGIEAFPFTYEKIHSIISEDDALFTAGNKMCLQTLLATPERNYLISSDGTKVPIRDIENKVVALYFYEDGLTEELTKKLKHAYKQLEKQPLGFVVVLVYLNSTMNTFGRVNQDTFNHRFKGMPWLALPFGDPKCKKVERVFDYPFDLDGSPSQIPDPSLVIIGPRGEFVGRFGSDIFMKFGKKAYPFTRESVVKMEVNRLKKLTPFSLLVPCVVLRTKDGSKEIDVLRLMREKRILLIIETETIDSTKFLEMLKDKYLETRGTDGEFEVIHICLRRDQSACCKEGCGEEFPWSFHHFHGCRLVKRHILKQLFMYNHVEGTVLVAFKRGGMLVRKAWHATKDIAPKDMNFPFIAIRLEDEIWFDMNDAHNFDHYDDE